LPVLGTLFGLGLGAFAIMFRKEDVLKAAFGVFVICALLAGAAYFTGEGAEESAEAFGLGESFVELHETVAVFALIASGVLGLLSLAGLLVYRARVTARPFAVSAMGLALVVTGVMTYVANLGGQIRHVEIRRDAPVESVRLDGTPSPARADRYEDDD
jgi:hypothetical protein